MREITDETFEAEVLRPSKPVVIDFWAPWCGPCKAVEPVLADLAEAHAGRVDFVKLNIDENPLVGVALRRARDPDRDPLRRRRGARDRRRRPLALALRGRLGGLAQPSVAVSVMLG